MRISARGRGELALQAGAEKRQRPADHEVEDADDAEDHERLEDLVGDDVAGARQLGEADDGGERGALDELHQEADRRRAARCEGLRQDDVASCGET